jgi:hypothetical protein
MEYSRLNFLLCSSASIGSVRFKKFWLKRLQNDATAKTTLKKHKCRFVLVPKCITQVPKCPGAEVSSIFCEIYKRGILPVRSVAISKYVTFYSPEGCHFL